MPEYLQGAVERITYQAEDTGYTVARLSARGNYGKPVTIIGPMAAVQPGESVRLEGEWTTHPQYGRQFKFTRYTTVYPATVEGIRKYLGSGLIKGIGPVTAKKIVAHFALETLDVIENDPDKLLEVPGTGPKRVAIIKSGWETQKAIKEVMLFLQSNGVSTAYAVKIYKQYGDEAIELVRENPYRLERDIWGIGFLTADRIAQNMGIKANAPTRIQAGLRYVLNQASDQGHVFLPREELFQATQQELEIDETLIPSQLEVLAAEEGAIIDGDRVYLPPLYYAETGIVSSFQRLLKGPPPRATQELEEILVDLDKKSGMQYEETQREAICTAARSKVMILTGGPGTGKTTITRGILELFERQGMRVLLCSPTGRAAKKLSEATLRPAQTIHRLLGFKPPKGFEHDQDSPLLADAVIADEVSMVDTVLMHNLLKAVPNAAQLVVVGDVDQLPSVGAGSVLKDLIECGTLPVVRLTHIFRQAQESQIITNAHKVNRGQFPSIDNRKARDFFFIEEEEPEQIVELIQDLCADRLPRRYRFDPIEDIQVLTPMYRSITGASHLNGVLQQRLNPNGQSWKRGNTEYRVGDKVMQLKNNYDKLVFNGDVGRILSIDLENQKVLIRFDEDVEYEFSEMDEVVLAYAVSVHKSQGSEYRAVIIPLTTQHYMMLQRNLLYTAITRARELVVLVGTKKALSIAVRNAKITQRYTALEERLGQGIQG